MLPKQDNKADIDGYKMLMLSVVTAVLTMGISYLYYLKKVFHVAKHSPDYCHQDVILCVLGKRLLKDKPDKEYLNRLKCAQRIMQDNNNMQVMILGGKTGKASITEAAAGRNYLVESNIDDKRIILEEASRNTLENIKNAFAELKKVNKEIVIVSNRYHLARAKKMAQGFGLQVHICAAENKLELDVVSVYKLLVETFHLHWYEIGLTYAKLTNNKQMLRRLMFLD